MVWRVRGIRGQRVIADLKPYPAYKDSGIPWMGPVPKHWSVNRIKTVLAELDCRSIDGDGTLMSLTRVRGLIPHSDRTAKVHSAKTLVGYKRYQPGQIVMNRMQAWSGMFGAGSQPGLVSPDYAVFKILGGYDTRLVLERLKTADLVGQFANESKGIGSGFNRLYTDRFGPIPISLPPLSEQAAIVKFLDWANARLERTIRAKRRVIALLTEQKQAIIHRAVTRGLDPNVPLKPSGIAWLGGMPAHWEMRRLRTLVHRIDQGVSPLAVGFLAEGNSWGVLKSGCVNRGTFRETEHKQLARDFEIDPSIVVKVGDVLISRACGSPTLVGSVGRVRSLNYRLILSDKIFRAVFKVLIDEDFMVLVMNSRYYRQHVEQAISGAEGMANNLPLSSLRGFSFAIPPLDEATAISAFVNAETKALDTAISRLSREIDLLLEYRTRLVADVVTGKLDVREAAARLPLNEVELALEPEALALDDGSDEEVALED